MASKSKSQLRTENTSNFPNNNTGFITPERLRTFNGDVIDSFVVNSGTGSLLTTASFDNGTRNLTFTKGDASTFDVNIPGGGGGTVDTGSLLTTSSFDNGTRNLTFTKGDGSTYTNNIPTVDTGSLIETASVSDATITFTKGDGTTFNILVNNVSSSISASHAEFADQATQASDLFITVKNTSGADIGKGLAVHATGVTGENVDIKLADSDIPGDMPAIGLTETAIPNNANGRVIINGRLKGIDTSLLVAGNPVYVNGAGTLSATKPTGSGLIQNVGTAAKINAIDGEIILQGSGRTNDLPNLTSGYIWLGNNNGVPAEFSTGSIAFTNKNNTFTGTQNFTNISVSGTGSFGYIQSVTGSAKIIGDAFIILNNNTPAERYAGLSVYDSGSANVTASLWWDGNTNDWKYAYSSSATHEAAVLLTGPEMNDISGAVYPSSNVLQMGGGGHHIVDSILNQNGTTQIQLGTSGAPIAFPNFIVHTTTAGGSYGVVKIQDNGSGNDGGFENTTFHGPSFNERAFRLFGGGNGTSGNLILVAPDDGETDVFKTFNFQNGTTLKTLDSASFEGQTNVSGPSNFSNTVDISGNTTISGITSLQGAITASGASRFTSNITISDGASLDSNGTITTSGIIRSTAAQGFQLGSSGTPIQYPNSIIHTDTDIVGGAYGTFVIQDNGSGNNGGIEITTYHGPSFNQRAFRVVGGGNGTSGTTILAALDDGSVQYYKNSVWQSGTSVGVSGSLYASSDVNLSGTVNLTGTLTASLAEGYTWVGGAGNVSELVPTSSFGGAGIFAPTGSYYATTNDLQVTGSFGVKGAIGGENEILSITSLTASIDLTTSNTYELTLVSSADTHLDVTTFGEDAQSVNVLVKQPAAGNTGSISFSSDFKFAGGYSYIPTPANSSEDILSFTRFGNFLYGTYLNNFS